MTKRDLESEIQSITKQLIENYGAEKIILFGSAACGNFSENSDLDFLIIKENIPHLGKDRLLELDRLIQYRLPTDMLAYKPREFEELRQMGDPFIKKILSEGRVLHG